MKMSSEQPLTTAPPAGRPEFSGTKALFFLPAAAVAGMLVGGAASVAQSWFAPLFFFPLLVGVVLGAVLVALLRTTHTAHRATLILGVLLAMASVAVTQHYVSYRVWINRLNARPNAQLAQAAFADQLPQSFPQFLRWEASRGRPLMGGYVARGVWAWASWAADAVLVLLGGLAIVLPALGLPYCRQCQTWYRTTRSGRLRQPFAQRLAEMFQISSGVGGGPIVGRRPFGSPTTGATRCNVCSTRPATAARNPSLEPRRPWPWTSWALAPRSPNACASRG
jgi:hypothetical protein